MKYLFLFLVSMPVFADEVLIGAFTHHFPINAHMDRYSNKVNDQGDILNPMLGYRITEDRKDETYRASTYFIGENSIGNAMAGYTFSPGVRYGDVRIGLVIGGYVQNTKQFRDKDIVMPSVPLGDFGIVPVGGIEMGYTVGKTTIYVVTTPVLMTTVIGVNF